MKFTVSFLVILCWLCSYCHTLKCQTDDGITEEGVRRIVRVCMRKIGENTYDSDSDYDKDDSEEYDDQDEKQEDNDRNYNRRRHYGSEDDYRQRNRNQYRGYRKSYSGGSYDDYDNGYGGYGSSRGGGGDNNRNGNNKNVSLTDKQAERDKACIVHCFFQEMKMVSCPNHHKAMIYLEVIFLSLQIDQ